MLALDDTIVAIASPPAGAARGIVRLSGPHVAAVVARCFQTDVGEWAARRVASVIPGTIQLPEGRTLPSQLYYWPTARSYTRQPAAELHTLGSPPLLSAIVAALCQAGARPAGPGEFTLRAFFAGRIDLTQAEAVLGVIDARGDDDLHAALEQLAGGLAHPLRSLRESLLELLAHLEAGLDFVEEDIEFVTRRQLISQLDRAAAQLDRTTAQLATRDSADALPRVALVGWPNVGKSSLFNALAGEAALVSDVPGTTRDYLRAAIKLPGGARCELVDTAGREPDSTDAIDQQAQQLAIRQAGQGDVTLLCLDASRRLNAWEVAQLLTTDTKQIVVWTKCDAAQPPASPAGLATSAATGAGLDELRRQLARTCSQLEPSASSLTAARSADSIRLAAEAIDRARSVAASGLGDELVAAELRLALSELGKVIGAVYTDDILDRIFSRFCIGK